jgi:hypothetical protein
MGKPKVIKIDDIEYVRADKINVPKEVVDYVIVRTYSAGVFAGEQVDRNGKTVELKNARRLWYWDGAASLSQLAMEGTCKPENCKFPCEVTTIILTEAVEIIPCTKKAMESIKGVKVWIAS